MKKSPSSPLPKGFVAEPLTVPLEQLSPSRPYPQAVRTSRKYRQIRASINAIGLIEPLNVVQPDKRRPQFILLDGHIRLMALQELGFADAPCLIATDDESYTYNNRVNRLATVQEHAMLRRAVDRGMSPQRLADALDVNIRHIAHKLNMLEGICPEAVELLKMEHFSANIGRVLRKMKPVRQVQCIRIMKDARSLTVSFAKTLLEATTPDLRLEPAHKTKGATAAQMANMQQEMSSVYQHYQLIDERYGRDALVLGIAQSYLRRLMGNEAVARFLRTHHHDMAVQFDVVIATQSLENERP